MVGTWMRGKSGRRSVVQSSYIAWAVVGRSLVNNLTNLGITEVAREVLQELGFDLDDLRAGTDERGEAAVVPEWLREETRASDLVARVGGDEFVLVFPGLSDVARLGQIAARQHHGHCHNRRHHCKRSRRCNG